MKKFMVLLVLALVIGFAGTASAVQTVALAAQGRDTTVGGIPLMISFTATSEGSEAAITFTTTGGFFPDVVVIVDDYNATNPNVCIWQKGMAEPSALYITGSSGAFTYVTTNAINPADGSIVVGVACQINDGNVVGYAIRYAQ